MSRPLEAAPSGTRLTLPGAGRPRRAPPSGWRLPQSRRFLAPNGIAIRVGEPDDARAFDFPLQRRGLNGQAAHEAPSSRSPTYRGDARRCKQLSLRQAGANVLPQVTVGQAGDHCVRHRGTPDTQDRAAAKDWRIVRRNRKGQARCHRFGRQGAPTRKPAGGTYTLHPPPCGSTLLRLP